MMKISKHSNFKAVALVLSGIFIASAIGIKAFTIDTNVQNLAQYIQKIVLTSDGGSAGTTGIILDGSDGSIYASGNVGIGIITPEAKLDIDGGIKSNGNIVLTAGTGNNTNIITYNGTDNGLYVQYSSGLAKNTLSANGVSYINGGNVGIGTTTPAEKLHVDGAIVVGDTTTSTTGAIKLSGTNFYGYAGVASGRLQLNN